MSRHLQDAAEDANAAALKDAIASGTRPRNSAPRGRPPRRSPPPRRCWPSSARSCARTMLIWPSHWAGWPHSMSSGGLRGGESGPAEGRWTSCGRGVASPIGGSSMPGGCSQTPSAWPGWTGTGRRLAEADRLNRTVLDLNRAGQYAEAIPRHVRRWRSARRCWATPPSTAASLNNLALLLQEQGDSPPPGPSTSRPWPSARRRWASATPTPPKA